MAMIKQTGVRLVSIDEHKPLIQQQSQINIPVASRANSSQPQPNLPRLDLLTGEDYFKIGVPLYEAAIKSDWRAAKDIFDTYPEKKLERYSITENGETTLHVAASAKGSKQKEFVKNLVDLMEKEDLALENKNCNTPLYLAAEAGNFETVKIMVEKNSTLVTIPGAGGQIMPLYAAALLGNYKVVQYLYEMSKELDDDGWTPQNRGSLLEKCIENCIFDVALKIAKRYPELSSGSVLAVLARKPEAFCEIKSSIVKRIINLDFAVTGLKVRAPEKESQALPLLRIIWQDILKRPKNVIDDILRGPPDLKQDNKPASGNVDQALQLQKLISEHIVNMHVKSQKIIRGLPDSIKQDTNPASGEEDQALQLQKVISEHITKMQVETQNIIRGPTATYSSRILFVATEMGNAKFLVELIRQYPDLIWKVNDNNQSIFHIAVEHRHEGIYNLLYEIGSMKDLITTLIDKNGNNMLHLVGMIPKKKRLQDVTGVAFQMQQELLWFMEVASMIPPSYREKKNKDGLKPRELFTKEHQDLHTQSVKWMKGTANQGMVVAALIATIVFAAAVTVPGGYNQDTGIPIFYRNQMYMIFVVADALSLFSSSTCMFLFISLLTSGYAEQGFLESMKKLMFFLATLMVSITTMMIAFSVTFIVLYHKYLKWMMLLFSFFGMQALLFVQLQYPLFNHLFRSTYVPRYLFKPQKHALYYENPKV